MAEQPDVAMQEGEGFDLGRGRGGASGFVICWYRPAIGGAGTSTLAVPSLAPEPGAEAPEHLNKYVRMAQMGVPHPAIAHKMRQDGLDPRVLKPYLGTQRRRSRAGSKLARCDPIPLCSTLFVGKGTFARGIGSSAVADDDA